MDSWPAGLKLNTELSRFYSHGFISLIAQWTGEALHSQFARLLITTRIIEQVLPAFTSSQFDRRGSESRWNDDGRVPVSRFPQSAHDTLSRMLLDIIGHIPPHPDPGRFIVEPLPRFEHLCVS